MHKDWGKLSKLFSGVNFLFIGLKKFDKLFFFFLKVTDTVFLTAIFHSNLYQPYTTEDKVLLGISLTNRWQISIIAYINFNPLIGTGILVCQFLRLQSSLNADRQKALISSSCLLRTEDRRSLTVLIFEVQQSPWMVNYINAYCLLYKGSWLKKIHVLLYLATSSTGEWIYLKDTFLDRWKLDKTFKQLFWNSHSNMFINVGRPSNLSPTFTLYLPSKFIDLIFVKLII